MMKKIILTLSIVLFSVLGANAQEAGKIRGGLDFGYAGAQGGDAGAIAAFELNYNIMRNLSLGARFETAFLAKGINIKNIDEGTSIAGNLAYLGTLDYYFNYGGTRFAPFIGVGGGYYSFASVKVHDVRIGSKDSGKMGGLVRAGFEYRKLRIAATYNMIPKSNYEADNFLDNVQTGNLRDVSGKNSYFSVSIGFYIGGGSWKK